MTQLFGCKTCLGTYHDTHEDGTIYFHACPPVTRVAPKPPVVLPDQRNENLVINSRGRIIGITAEGEGVTCLSDASLTEPAWITAMKKELAKQEED